MTRPGYFGQPESGSIPVSATMFFSQLRRFAVTRCHKRTRILSSAASRQTRLP
jgi:hypothetical protein